MCEQSIGRWHLIFQALAALGTIITGVAVLVAYFGIKEDHDYNRRRTTTELMAQTIDKFDKIRPELIKHFPELFDDSTFQPLSAASAKNLFNACRITPPDKAGRTFDCEARKVAGQLLDLYEMVASAHWNHVADRTMIEVSFGDWILRDFTFFEQFINYVGQNRSTRQDKRFWPPLHDFVNYLKRQGLPRNAGPPPTGTLIDGSP